MCAYHQFCRSFAGPPGLRQAVRLAGLCLLLLLGGAAARAAAEPPADSASRYLFIVDASFSMGRLQNQLPQTISALIENGLEGRMHSGDTFGLWTFSREVNTGFPMQTWENSRRHALAAVAVSHIKKQPFQNQGRFAPVIADVLTVVQSVKDLTVLILTDGDEPIKGTRFDAPINVAMKANAAKLRSARQPILVALVARGGELVTWGVNSTEQLVPLPKPPPVEIPPLAAKPASVPATNTPPLPPVTTNTTASARTAKPALSVPPQLAKPAPVPATNQVLPTPPPKSATPRAPIIITRESIKPKPADLPSNTAPVLAVVPPPPPPVHSNPPAPIVFAPTDTNPAPALAANSPHASNPPPVLAVTPPPASNAPSSALLAPTNPPAVCTSTLTAVVALAGPSEPAPPADMSAADDAPVPIRWLLCAGGAFLSLLLAVWFAWRRRARACEPSLITRSLTRISK